VVTFSRWLQLPGSKMVDEILALKFMVIEIN